MNIGKHLYIITKFLKTTFYNLKIYIIILYITKRMCFYDKKVLNNELVSYIFFGFLTTILNFSIFFILEKVLDSNKSFINNLIAWSFGIFFSYIVSNIFTFKMCFKGIKTEISKMFKFVSSRLFSLFIEEIGILIFIDNLSFNKFIIKVFLGIIVIVINYIFSKFIVFKKDYA